MDVPTFFSIRDTYIHTYIQTYRHTLSFIYIDNNIITGNKRVSKVATILKVLLPHPVLLIVKMFFKYPADMIDSISYINLDF